MDTQVVSQSLSGLVIIETIYLLEVRIGDLVHILADLDLRDDLAFLVFHCRQLINAAEYRLTAGGDHTLADTKGIDIRILQHQILNDVLIQRVGDRNLTLGPTGVVQHLTGLAGEVCHIAGVQTDTALGNTLRTQHLIESTDGVGHAGFQRIVGIHQQRGIVGIVLAIGTECIVLCVKHLDPGMCHGAGSRNAEQFLGNGTGRTLAAADVCGAGTQHSTVGTLRAAGTELQHRTPLRSTHDTAGLGGDQALMVDGQQRISLNELCLYGGGTHRQHRLTRENGRTLGNSPDVTGEVEVA